MENSERTPSPDHGREAPKSGEMGTSAELPKETPPTPAGSPPSVPVPPVSPPPAVPSSHPPTSPATGPEPQLSAPALSAQELAAARRLSPKFALRWLAAWWERQLKKLSGGKVSASERKALDLVFLEVLVPRENEIKANAAEQLFAALTGLYRGGGLFSFFNPQASLSLEIVADPDHIHFVVVSPRELKDLVEKQIHAAYPIAEVREVPEYDIFQKEGYVSFTELATSGPKYYSLKTYVDLAEVDPLNGILSALTKFSPGEAATVQITISPAGSDWQKQGYALLRKVKEKPEEGQRSLALGKEMEEGIGRKIIKNGFYALVRVVTVSPSQASADLNLQNILAGLAQLSAPQMASFQERKSWNKNSFMVDFLWRHVPRLAHWTVLSTEELATLFHFPNKNNAVPNISWLGAKTGAAPLELPAEGLYLGGTSYQGAQKKVYLKRDDRRRHLYVLGQTGTGKSEFLKSLAYQDILAGEGTCFIDPHGDTVEDLLKMVPEERVNDVVYFDPGDSAHPPGLNIMEAETEEGKHLAINAFIALLYKLYDPNRTGVMGPRLERAIRNVMLTAMSEKGNTLIEVVRLLTDPAYAATKVPLIADPMVKRYWTDELAQTSDFHKSEVLGYFVSKFDRFVTEHLMRNIIGQSVSSFNFRQAMDQRKILLVNLAKGKIGEENSNFLGLIMVPRILTAAMSRVDTPEAQRPDFYLYVDEFQNFTTPDFVQILSEARKYRLNLTVANQFIGQLSDEIKNAVFGNVGTAISFRVGADDAEYLEKQFAPSFSKSDLMNASLGHTYMRLLIDGVPSTPFSMATDWPAISSIPRSPERAERIKALSRQKYTRPIAEVEKEISQRAGF